MPQRGTIRTSDPSGRCTEVGPYREGLPVPPSPASRTLQGAFPPLLPAVLFVPFWPPLARPMGAEPPPTRKGPAGTTWCGTTCGQRHGVGAQEIQGAGEAGGSQGTGDTAALGTAAPKGSAIGLMASSPSPHVSIHRRRSRAAPRGRVVPTPSPGSWHGAGRPGWS